VTSPGGHRRPVACCDLDGVVWRGEVPITGAAHGVTQLRDAGLRVVFLTNNSSGRVQDNLDRLAAAGIAAAPDDLVEIDRLTLVDEDRSVAPVYRKLRPEKVHEFGPMQVARGKNP